MLMTPRAEFALKDPGALAALLNYDWRGRRLLTDAEATGAEGRPAVLAGPASTSVLRQMQRLGWIHAVHGVRPHGGRMRLWPLRDILKAQIALDLRERSGAKLARCIEALHGAAAEVERVVARWESWAPARTAPEFEADHHGGWSRVFADPDTLAAFADASVAAFVVRARFDEVEPPAFLL